MEARSAGPGGGCGGSPRRGRGHALHPPGPARHHTAAPLERHARATHQAPSRAPSSVSPGDARAAAREDGRPGRSRPARAEGGGVRWITCAEAVAYLWGWRWRWRGARRGVGARARRDLGLAGRGEGVRWWGLAGAMHPLTHRTEPLPLRNSLIAIVMTIRCAPSGRFRSGPPAWDAQSIHRARPRSIDFTASWRGPRRGTCSRSSPLSRPRSASHRPAGPRRGTCSRSSPLSPPRSTSHPQPPCPTEQAG
jgi:hypothetical protein